MSDNLTTPEIRARHDSIAESVSSSRFFPGGWFSSSPKLSQFDSLPESGEANDDELPPSAVDEESKDRKKWCIVM
jgi:hypothetical protein